MAFKNSRFSTLNPSTSPGTLPDVLKVPPNSGHRNVNGLIGKFSGADQFRDAVNRLQNLLYAE